MELYEVVNRDTKDPEEEGNEVIMEPKIWFKDLGDLKDMELLEVLKDWRECR